MDACELKFPDQLFDCIFSKATLDIVASNYVYEPTINDDLDELQQILREIWRCLQPGGVWIIVSCHGSRSAHVAPLDYNDSSSSSSDAGASERLHKPWWQWRGIHEFIERHYDLAKSYGAGIPLIQDGKRVKPFIVMVFKRKEANRQQHLSRLYRNQIEETRSEWEFALATQWHLEKRRWHAEETSTVRETREMVVEDAAARCRESELLYQSGMRAREATRAEIYRVMLATDRALMIAEDALAAAVRAEAIALVAFIRKVLLDVADSAVALALVKECERAAAAVAVVEKEPVADKRISAEAAAKPHQAEMKTAVTIPAVVGSDSSAVDSSLTIGNTIQSVKLATSTAPDDSLVTSGGVQKAAEVHGESAIAISGHDSLRELQHISAQETVAPAAIEDHPVADRVEQVPAGQDREDSKDNAISDVAQCAENIKKSELPVAAGDSSETNYTTTGESEQFGGANMTLVGEAKRVIDNKVEAAASASTIVAEDLPAVTMNAQLETTAHQTSSLPGVDVKAENDKSRSHLLVIPPDADSGEEDGRTSGEVLISRGTAVTADQHAVALSKVMTEDLKPSRDGEQVGKVGSNPDRESVGNGSTTSAKSRGGTDHEGGLSTGNGNSSTSPTLVGGSVPPSAPSDSISEKTETASGALDDAVVL